MNHSCSPHLPGCVLNAAAFHRGEITYIAFEPSQYRDIKAAFDPTKKGSANLLAGVGGLGLLGLGLDQE